MKFLKQTGIKIIQAENGDEALRILSLGNSPDIIIMDVQIAGY